MFVLHFHVEEWRFASTKVHTWYCLKTRKFQSTQWGIGQIKADRKRWWKNTILSLSLQESTAWSICHWGEKDEEDDEIDRRYRPACNFSYFNAFQDPLWLDGMQDTFYTLFWFRPSPILKEKREFRCGLKAQVFFFFLFHKLSGCQRLRDLLLAPRLGLSWQLHLFNLHQSLAESNAARPT